MGKKNCILDNEEPQLTLSRDQGIPVFDGEVEIVSKGMPIVTDHDEEDLEIYLLNIRLLYLVVLQREKFKFKKV